MQFTIPAPKTYEEIDEGVYKGSDGNFYEDETILRYRVMRKHTANHTATVVGVYTLAGVILIQLILV